MIAALPWVERSAIFAALRTRWPERIRPSTSGARRWRSNPIGSCIHVDLRWNETWSDTDQVRFCKVDEQTLTYTSPPAKNPFDGREVVHEVTFERE